MFRKKKPETAVIEAGVEEGQKEISKQEHIVTKTDFPVKCPVITHNFGDLLRYFLYNMSSGMITATVERMVQRELANRHDFPTKLFFSLIALGIMIFLIFMGAMVFYQAGPGAVQAVQSGASGAGGALGGVLHG